MRKIILLSICSLAVACSIFSDQENLHSDEQIEATAQSAEPLAEEATGAEGAEGAAEDEMPGMSPMWSDEGLDAQDRMDELRQLRDGAPGTTDWSDAGDEIPDELGESDADKAVSPGALLVELMDAMNVAHGLGTEIWEQTIRIHQQDDEEAVGVLLQWGFRDDSMAGSDLRAHMKRGDSGWYIDRLQRRFHCARGVTEDGLCL